MNIFSQVYTFKLWVVAVALLATALLSSLATYQVVHTPSLSRPVLSGQSLVCPPCLSAPAQDSEATKRFHDIEIVPNNDGKRF